MSKQWEYQELVWKPLSIVLNTFEYWHLQTDHDRQWRFLTEALNDLGKDGWECCAAVPYQWALVKREYQNEQ